MKSFAIAQSKWDDALPIDTSRIDDAIEREGERIANNPDDLRKVLKNDLCEIDDLDTDCCDLELTRKVIDLHAKAIDMRKRLVEIRLVLRNAVNALGAINTGYLSSAHKRELISVLLLARRCDAWVADTIEQEAATRIVLDREGGR
jgi:hypothetical protein